MATNVRDIEIGNYEGDGRAADEVPTNNNRSDSDAIVNDHVEVNHSRGNCGDGNVENDGASNGYGGDHDDTAEVSSFVPCHSGFGSAKVVSIEWPQLSF